MRIHRMAKTDMSVSESPHANELGVRLLERLQYLTITTG